MWPIPQASQEKVLAAWVRIFTRIAPRLIYIARLSLSWTDSNREITTTNDGGWTAWYVKILALGSLENTCWCLLNARMLSVFQSGSVTARIRKWREKLQVRWIYELTKTWKCNFITQHLIHGDLRAPQWPIAIITIENLMQLHWRKRLMLICHWYYCKTAVRVTSLTKPARYKSSRYCMWIWYRVSMLLNIFFAVELSSAQQFLIF